MYALRVHTSCPMEVSKMTLIDGIIYHRCACSQAESTSVNTGLGKENRYIALFIQQVREASKIESDAYGRPTDEI
jgi:hypothetical protein